MVTVIKKSIFTKNKERDEMKKINSTSLPLIIFIFTLVLVQTAFAHDTPVHQYIVKQAYYFLENEKGPIPELRDRIGLSFVGSGDDDDPWQTGYIGVGAMREDLEDPLWGYGDLFEGWTPTSTHFWDADNGDDVLTPIPGSPDAFNAYYKARTYLFGGHRIFFQKYSIDPELGVIFGYLYSYSSIIELYKTGHCFSEGYVALDGNYYTWTPEEIYMDLEAARKMAAMILGRVAHLLTDMSVPAHTHNDLHAFGDGYEDWMAAHYLDGYYELPFIDLIYWDAWNAARQGPLIDPYQAVITNDWIRQIRYLFYTGNQIADRFPSDDNDGDNNYSTNYNGDDYTILNLIQEITHPYTAGSVTPHEVNTYAFRYCIRAVAGLFYWFANETGMITKITAKNNFEYGTIKVGVNTTPTQKNSPYIFGAITGQTVNLEAQNQSYGGYERVWNTGGVSNSISKWTRQVGSTITNLTNGGNITYSFTVTTSDDNASYIANLKKNYRIDQSHTFEFDATQNQQNTSYIVEQNSGEILAPSNKTVSSKNYKFIRWEDVASNPRIISPGDNENYTAYYKFPNHSNYLSAYSNNGSKQFLRTPDGRLHKAYESINGVWYEMSEDNGQTWQIIGSNFNTNGWSSHQPSLSYYQDGADKIHVFMYYRLLRGEPNDWLQFQEYIYDSSPNPEIYESENLSPSNPIGGFTYTNPIIACAENGKILFVWESSLNGVGQKLIYSYGKKLSNGYWEWYDTGTLEFTNNGAKNPTVVASQNLNDLKFHLAWNEGYEVYYTALYPDASNHMLNTGKQWVSNGSGYPYNNKPSIIEMSNLARISWIGSRFIDESPTGQVEYKTILKNLGNNTYKRFGSNTTSVSLTRDEDNSEYFLAWSESNTHSNKFVTSDNFSQIFNLAVTGDYVKLSTGDDPDNISAMIYNTANQPYLFSKSSSLYDIMNPMNKITSLSINTGREGVVYIDTAQFYFAIGDIVVDNQTIDFVEIPDSVTIDSKETLNQYFISNSFQVTDNSSFYYTVQYGITDSLTAYNLLGENDYINFKVELIDDVTDEILGQFDDVVFNRTNLELYDNISYRVNTEGIGNRTVRLKLVTDNNFNPEYSISQMLSDEYVLGKQVPNEINYKGSLKVETYDLAQNYPNPFNPSTTIKYQIPNAGNVTLKVYDILGREVTTLVDEFKNEGRYEVNFNAGKLASGVYIYTIKSNDFTASKKLMLLK